VKTAPTRTVKALRVRLPRSKYGNTKVVIDGITFDSKAEGRRYQDLCYLQQAGKITKLHPHPVYELLPAFTDRTGKRHRRTTYIGDFFYYDDDFNAVVEDVKGRETEVFKIKAKMFQHRYPSIKFVIVREN
jgi:Protein of unknown function (DUF1064).